MIYQRAVASYRDQDHPRARAALADLIDKISSRVPAGLTKIRRLGAALKHRASDILAYFDHPRTSNGPTGTINGRLEHLRGIALGFRNLTNYNALSPPPHRRTQRTPTPPSAKSHLRKTLANH